MNKIQSLWIGNKISSMEKMCLSSYTKNGLEHHLYVYEDISDLPSDIILKDANEILPESEIFSYNVGEGKGSVSAFSNYFRYNLLYKKGGWWVDTDMICLRSFSHDLLSREYVFSSELDHGIQKVTSGLIKAPKGSSLMLQASEICNNKNKNTLKWGEVGPSLVGNLVLSNSMTSYVEDYDIFCPLSYNEWTRILNPDEDIDLSKSFTIHLWNEMWRRSKYPKDRTYNRESLYQKLKEKYL